MKLNIGRLAIACFTMIGITLCLSLPINNYYWWNIINYFFYELIGVIAIYTGIPKEEVQEK